MVRTADPTGDSMSRFQQTRRGFLQGTLAGVAASPLVLNGDWLRAQAPSKMVNVGFIGVGNQGMNLLNKVLQYNLANVVAVCDVNEGSFGYREPSHFYGREPAKKIVDEHFGKLQGKTDWKGCQATALFEEVLENPNVDAVIVVVPDHWHAVISTMAAKAGKAVYCEKPLSLTVADGQEMVDAAHKYKTIFQTGSHERSNPISKFVCDKVLAGAIGKVTRVETTIGHNNKPTPGPGWKPQPVPATFDYERWLGPAQEEPYHPERCLYRFRFIYDYSGGQITNFGAHCNDIAQWGLGRDLSGPVEYECTRAVFPEAGSLFNTALESTVKVRYADGLELTCTSGKPVVQTRFEGEDGWLQTGYGGTTASRKELLEGLPNTKGQMDATSLHLKNFFDTIKGEDKLHAPVEIGHSSATMCHLMNIAIRRFPETPSKVLKWDANAVKFTNDDNANALLSRPRREPWTVA